VAQTEEKIPIEELYAGTGADTPSFPKYTTQLLNLANQNAQGTRPDVVGQVSELIDESGAQTYEEWKEWYLERHPQAIERATEKVKEHVANLRDALEKIDEDMVRRWVEDLVLVKTAQGLLIEQTVLEYLADRFEVSYEQSSPQDESEGIDGYVGGRPVSVKPESYESKPSTKHETIDAALVYYKTTDKYLTIAFDEADFEGVG